MTITANGKPPATGEEGYAYEGMVDVSGEVVETTFPGVEEIREMVRRDGQGQAMDYALTLPIRRNTYDIEAAKNGKSAAKLCREVLLYPEEQGGMTTPMENVIAQMTTAIAYGKACFEKVWDTRDGKNILRKLAFRPAITTHLKLDKNGSFDGFYQDPVVSGILAERIYFKPVKSFVYLHQGHLDPGQGRSAYVAAYNRYQHKKKVESLLFQHLMRFAGGIRWGKYGGPQGKAGAAAFFENLAKIRGQGTIITGTEDEISVINSDTTEEFQRTLSHLDSEMARSVLCQFLMLGTEANVGSWALSKDHSDFFLLALEAIMREMETFINKYVLGALVRFNFGIDTPIPRFRFQALDETTRQLAHETWMEAWKTGSYPFNPEAGPPIESQARQAMRIPPEQWNIPDKPLELPPTPVVPLVPAAPPGVPSSAPPGSPDTGRNASPGDQSQAARQAQAQSRTRQPAGVSPGGAGTPGNSKIGG